MKHKQNEIYSIDYYAYISGIKHWNPAFKVFFAFFIMLFCVAVNNIFVSAFIFFTMLLFTVCKGKIPFFKYLSFFAVPIFFVIFGSVAIAVGISANAVGEYHVHLKWFYFYTSSGMMKEAWNLILKALGAVSAMYMLILSTPVSEIISVFQKSHFPNLIIELMHMMYRFIFILLDAYCKMKYSAQSRLGYCDFKTSCFTFGNIASNLFFISLKKANTYYDALIARCYEGKLLFLEEETKVKFSQIMGAGVYFICLFFIWLWTK